MVHSHYGMFHATFNLKQSEMITERKYQKVYLHLSAMWSKQLLTFKKVNYNQYIEKRAPLGAPFHELFFKVIHKHILLLFVQHYLRLKPRNSRFTDTFLSEE